LGTSSSSNKVFAGSVGAGSSSPGIGTSWSFSFLNSFD
jgi:hypothetical protein